MITIYVFFSLHYCIQLYCSCIIAVVKKHVGYDDRPERRQHDDVGRERGQREHREHCVHAVQRALAAHGQRAHPRDARDARDTHAAHTAAHRQQVSVRRLPRSVYTIQRPLHLQLLSLALLGEVFFMNVNVAI